MKPILLFVLCVFTTLTTFAQDPELFETDWYIHKITVDNVETFPPNTTEPIPFEETRFINDTPSGMEAGYCDIYVAEITFDLIENSFQINTLTEFQGTCLDPSNLSFTSLYYYFLSVDNSTSTETFEYEVTISGDSKSLLLTNSLGDSVLYGDEVLGVADNEQPDILLYPNPTADFFHIKAGQQEVIDVTIYSLSGSQVRSISEVKNNNPIDVRSLQVGMYFVKITNADGQQQVLRFVKN